MIPVLSLVLLLAPPAVPDGVVDFGAGRLTVPSGCVHVPRQGIDSAVGAFECGQGRARVQYDIGGRADDPGWCGTEAPERRPERVIELRTTEGGKLVVCDLPSFYDDPARLVAVRRQASFYITLKDPTDATWLLAVALAYRPR
jgi:hypothetical protein